MRYKLGNKWVTNWVTNELQMRYKLANKWFTKKKHPYLKPNLCVTNALQIG